MSRTIRRKNGNPSKCGWSVEWETSTFVYHVSKYGGTYHTRSRLEGTALKKEVARYHSDAFRGRSAGVWERTTQHAKHRARVNTEFARYFKDAEYEVMIQANPRWPYWD